MGPQYTIGHLPAWECCGSIADRSCGVARAPQWKAQYGEVDVVPNGSVSVMAPSKHVYGGTRHHPAFKSVAKTLEPSRIIR